MYLMRNLKLAKIIQPRVKVIWSFQWMKIILNFFTQSKIKVFFQKDWASPLTFLLIQYLVQNRCRNEKQSRVGKVKAIPTRPSVKYLTGQSLARTRSEERGRKLTGRKVPLSVLKSDNLQYNTLGRWDERLIDQASDVPSIIFFHNFLQTQGTRKSLFSFL